MKEDVSPRYSLSYKQLVVSEIELGKISVSQAEKRYDISRRSIYNWIEQLGKNHILSKVIRVETTDENCRIKELEKRNKQLERDLAKTQLKVLALESLIEVAQDQYKTDFKKNFGPKGSGGRSSAEPGVV
jgi:transposase-like protein